MRKTLIILLYICLAFARLCAQQRDDCIEPSLGDTIFHETFGPRSIFSTNYIPSVNCPAPGTYSRGGDFSGCPFSTSNSGNTADGSDGSYYWYVRYVRHVPYLPGSEPRESSGIIVNAGVNRSILYQRHVTGLCGNTAYLLHTSILNLMREEMCDSNAITPSISILVLADNGDTILLNSNTLPFVTDEAGAIQKKQYQSYYYCLKFLTPPQSTGINIIIQTTNPFNNCGTYFDINDVRLNAIAPVLITVNNNGNKVVGICKYNNDPVTFKSGTSFKYPLFTWQTSKDSGRTFVDIPGQTADSMVLPGLDTGMHIYRIQASEAVNFNNRFCRVNSYPSLVYVQPAPSKTTPLNVKSCLDHQLILKGNGTPLHYWQGPGGFTIDRPNLIINPAALKDSGLYVVTENSGEFCTINDSFIVKIVAPPGLVVPASFKVCEGSSVQLTATGDGTFLWSPATGLSNANTGNPYATLTDTTKYKVYLTNAVCTDSAKVTVNVIKKLQVSAGPDMHILTGDDATLAATITGGVENFYWSPAAGMINSNTLKPTVSPVANETTYTLNATAANGCGSGSDDVIVYVYNDVYIPNAFTPNGDGKNDVFIIPPFSDLKVKHLSIYNRWGKLVFNNTNPGINWDGTIDGMLQPIGAYIYFVELVTPKGKLISRKGTLMLLR